MFLFSWWSKYKQHRAALAKEKKCVITIYLNSAHMDTTKVNGDALMIREGKCYRVRIAEHAPIKEVLAHELGHCVESMLGENWSTPSLQKYHRTGVVDLDILKKEASAWRFAVRMFPDIKTSIIHSGFMLYLQDFKRGKNAI